jgi:hypothetical protein
MSSRADAESIANIASTRWRRWAAGARYRASMKFAR